MSKCKIREVITWFRDETLVLEVYYSTGNSKKYYWDMVNIPPKTVRKFMDECEAKENKSYTIYKKEEA